MSKPIERDRVFEKHFKLRIARMPKLVAQFRTRYELFASGERGYPLNDHTLTGDKDGMRSFSITADIRVIYHENTDRILFLDIGTHAQVYK